MPTTTANNHPQTPTDTATSALLSHPLVQNTQVWLKLHGHSLRPWSQFFNRQLVSTPRSFNDALERLRHNFPVFRMNYALIVAALLIYTLITNLWLFLAVAIGAGGVVMVSRMQPGQLLHLGPAYTLSQSQLYGILAILEIPLLWVSAAGSAVFWVIGVAAVLICVHGTMLEKSVESEFAADAQV